MTATEGMVPLTHAAQRLRLTWHQAWKRVLLGELQGEQRAGRWFVSEADVERLERQVAA